MQSLEASVRDRLFSMQDPGYRAFHAPLIPEIPWECIIGVRVPVLRTYAKELWSRGWGEEYLSLPLPHRYYEENNLHAFLIEQLRDYDDCIVALDRFLPYVDNWATCDMMSPGCLIQAPDKLYRQCVRWLSHPHPFAVRYGMGMLMRYFLGARYTKETADAVAAVRREDYYVNMMQAWFFATALAYRYEEILPYLEGTCLTPWVRRKTIQKAIESRRIAPEQKAYLRTLRQKLPSAKK